MNVFLDPETRDVLRAQLDDTRARERLLEEANRRHWDEDTEDHALAKLLTKGSLRLTSFRARKHWYFKNKGAIIEATVLTGKTKAAVLFRVTNRDPSKPWSLAEARLLTTRPGEKPPPCCSARRNPLLYNRTGTRFPLAHPVFLPSSWTVVPSLHKKVLAT